jgi:hypothetical protein
LAIQGEHRGHDWNSGSDLSLEIIEEGCSDVPPVFVGDHQARLALGAIASEQGMGWKLGEIEMVEIVPQVEVGSFVAETQ